MNSMTMEFEVNNQIISRVDTQRVVEDSVNYLYAHFTFSEDWEGTTKAIVVQNDELNIKYKVYLNDEDIVKIPNAVINNDGFKIIAVGENSSSYVTITTQMIYIPVLKTMYNDAEEPDIRYITSNTLDIEKMGDEAQIEIPNIYMTDATFTNDILSLFARDNELIKSINFDYGKIHNITISIDNTNYKFTLNAYDKNNNLLFTREADFNIESMLVKSATYDSANKEIVIVFENDDVVRIPIGDILTGIATETWVLTNFYTQTQTNNLLAQKQNVIDNNNMLNADYVDDENSTHKFVSIEEKNIWNNKQDAITSSNKLNADYVDDSNATNKFVSASEKAQITTNANAISNIKDGTNIDSFGDVESALDLKADKSTTYTRTETDTLLNAKENIANKTTTLSSTSTDTQYPSAKVVYDNLSTKQATLTDSTSIDLTNNVVSVKDDYIDSQFLSNTERQDLIDEIMEVFENE